MVATKRKKLLKLEQLTECQKHNLIFDLSYEIFITLYGMGYTPNQFNHHENYLTLRLTLKKVAKQHHLKIRYDEIYKISGDTLKEVNSWVELYKSMYENNCIEPINFKDFKDFNNPSQDMN